MHVNSHKILYRYSLANKNYSKNRRFEVRKLFKYMHNFFNAVLWQETFRFDNLSQDMHMLKAPFYTNSILCVDIPRAFLPIMIGKKTHNERILCKLFLKHTGQKLVFCNIFALKHCMSHNDINLHVFLVSTPFVIISSLFYNTCNWEMVT